MTKNYAHIPDWDKLSKEEKLKISPNTFKRIETEEGHYVNNLQAGINRLYSNRDSWLRKYIYLINEHITEIVRDEDSARLKIDPLTVEIMKEILIKNVNDQN